MFKRDTNVYLQVNGGDYFELSVYPDASFSQVYSEAELPQKTLHKPENLISSGFTSSLNPGNFNFTIVIIDTANAEAVLQCLSKRDPLGHEIYLENNGSVIRLDSCVFENVVFNFVRNAISTVSMSGTYSYSEDSELPPSPLALGEVYTYIQGLSIYKDGNEITNITSLNFEISNEITWLDLSLIHISEPTRRS